MTEESRERDELDRLKSAIRDTVASGRDLQAGVRQLMIDSLRSMGVDPEGIEKVTRSVLEGVAAGISPQDSGAAVRQSVAGVQDALLHAAEASSLAIREAAGRASGFARNDLGKAVNDLAAMERQFVDILTDVAKAGTTTAQQGFADVLRHLQNSGSAFGEQLAVHVVTLQKLLAQRGQESLQAGAEAFGKTAQQLAELAASLLAATEHAPAGSAPSVKGGAGDNHEGGH